MTCCFCSDRKHPTWITCRCPGAKRALQVGFPSAWKEHMDRPAMGTDTATLRPPQALTSGSEAKAQVDAAVRAFANAISRGDAENRRWLISAAEAFRAGKPIPQRKKTGAAVVELYAPPGICPQCDRRRKRDGYQVKL